MDAIRTWLHLIGEAGTRGGSLFEPLHREPPRAARPQRPRDEGGGPSFSDTIPAFAYFPCDDREVVGVPRRRR